MIQTHIAAQQKMQFQPSLLGDLDAPRITLLGSLDDDQGTSWGDSRSGFICQISSLDDDQGTSGLKLEAQSPKPFLAIIYTGI
jgi:hypothetical protein